MPKVRRVNGSSSSIVLRNPHDLQAAQELEKEGTLRAYGVRIDRKPDTISGERCVGTIGPLPTARALRLQASLNTVRSQTTARGGRSRHLRR